jgi:hypothetical protein
VRDLRARRRSASIVTVTDPLRRVSVRDLVPRERGAIPARNGFEIQDHVAAGFLLELLRDPTLGEVWCETDDDILLIWDLPSGATSVEFVQVKSDNLDQLWSVATLCGGDPAKSILEVSLGRDSYAEPARFRLVTARDVKRLLRHLKLPREHPGRGPGNANDAAVFAEMPSHVKAFRSPKGDDVLSWLGRLLWEVRESLEIVGLRNHEQLEKLLASENRLLQRDQRDVLYARLVSLAKAAADDDGVNNKYAKRRTRSEVADALARGYSDLWPTGQSGPVESRLVDRLTEAGVGQESIRHAREAVLQYTEARRREDRYQPEEWAELSNEFGARMHKMWTSYESGELALTPLRFHDHCLEVAGDVATSLPELPSPPLWILQGMLYDRVARGLLRFVRTPL